MTKMAAMAYDFETWHEASSNGALQSVYINHDPGMTLTFLWQGQPRLPKHLNGENCYNVI